MDILVHIFQMDLESACEIINVLLSIIFEKKNDKTTELPINLCPNQQFPLLKSEDFKKFSITHNLTFHILFHFLQDCSTYVAQKLETE